MHVDFVSFVLLGIPMLGQARPAGQPPAPVQNTLFPAVLRDKNPSEVILPYIQGIGKRVAKISDARLMRLMFCALRSSSRSTRPSPKRTALFPRKGSLHAT